MERSNTNVHRHEWARVWAPSSGTTVNLRSHRASIGEGGGGVARPCGTDKVNCLCRLLASRFRDTGFHHMSGCRVAKSFSQTILGNAYSLSSWSAGHYREETDPNGSVQMSAKQRPQDSGRCLELGSLKSTTHYKSCVPPTPPTFVLIYVMCASRWRTMLTFMDKTGGRCMGTDPEALTLSGVGEAGDRFEHLMRQGTGICGPYVREPVRRPSDLVEERLRGGLTRRGVFVASVPLTSDPSPRVLHGIQPHAQPPCTSGRVER
jgi:hypothetical protein